MKTFSHIIFIVFIISSLLYPDSPEGSDFVEKESNIYSNANSQRAHNSSESFNNVLPREIYAFLIGNNNYSETSGFQKLTQCLNDLILVKQILINCCRIREKNIILSKDVSLTEVKNQLSGFIKTIGKKDLVIIYYSGHGDKDGSLVFTEGEKFTSKELRNYINSFSNDTVLIIDACYSGNQEGPNDFLPRELDYKTNCLRIYAALAHLSAKEITYDNPFFNKSLPFYKEVLQIQRIEGNGYFTALFGLFFAQYAFGERENVSFADVVYYITNKGKIYVETLAAKNKNGDKSLWSEEVFRLNQHPKIHPVDEPVIFKNPDHNYIILKQSMVRYRPVSNHLSLGLTTAAAFSLGEYNKSLDVGILPVISCLYNFYLGWGTLGCGFLTGIQWSATKSGLETGFNNVIFPLALHLKYFTDVYGPLFFSFDLSIGPGIQHLDFFDDSMNGEWSTKFFLSTGMAIGLNPVKSLGVALSTHYILLIPFNQLINNYPLYQLISPGLDIVYNFN